MDEIILLFSVAFAVFNIILLIKIWEMTNDVKELKTFIMIHGRKPKEDEGSDSGWPSSASYNEIAKEERPDVPASLVEEVKRQIPTDQAKRKDLFMGTTM